MADSDMPTLDFYQQMRERLREWMKGKGRNHKHADYVMFAPDLLHLLCKLVADKEVPTSKKAKLGTVIAYFVSPVDLVPEGVVGPVGYVDDVALAAYTLNDIVNEVGPEIVQKHWAGDGNVLEIIQGILSAADEMLGSGMWKQVKAMFGK